MTQTLSSPNAKAVLAKYKFVIVDGIMLYHNNSPVVQRLDTKFLLRASRDELRRRREKRNGYVTIDGFWQDPPGYFDKIVWPGYEKQHRYLFKENDVDGPLTNDSSSKLNIHLPSSTNSMAENLQWALGTIINEALRS